MVALNAERLQKSNLLYGRRFALDRKVLTRARRLVEAALHGHRALTRPELAAVLRRGGIDATGQRLAHVLFDLEQQAAICSGPLRGKQFTYALFDERVGAHPHLTRDEALAQLARRYFQSHGPATVRDFSWWSGLTMRDARTAIAGADAKPLLEAPPLQRDAEATYLLPNYDEYVIAYRDRGAVIDPARARNLGVFTTAEFPHLLIVEGRVAGSWRRTITANHLTVEIWPYRRLTARQLGAVGHQAARYGAFLGVPHTLRAK
jgi:hypothetical protein